MVDMETDGSTPTKYTLDQHAKLPLPFKCSPDAEPMFPAATRTLESKQDL